MAADARHDDPIRFAEKLITLLDQGGFTATYKYAVLVAIMDLCLERSARDGSAPAMLTTRQLAEKIVELYWPQTRPFRVGDRPLLQNPHRQARILALIGRFRSDHAPDPSASLYRSRLHAPRRWERLLTEVEWKLVEMPLPKLQRVGHGVDPFIYDIGWDDRVTRSAFNDPRIFDNRIHLIGRAGEHLVRLAGVLRPLVHRHWAAMVARLNAAVIADSGVEEFLFGLRREGLLAVRDPLLELQDGRCFYCDRGIRSEPHVDHFLPWARHPDNGIENLVVAHGRCNAAKSDFLVAADHVDRWTERLMASQDELGRIAEEQRWERDRVRTVNVIRAVYARLPDDIRLWRMHRDFVPLDRAAVATAFARVTC